MALFHQIEKGQEMERMRKTTWLLGDRSKVRKKIEFFLRCSLI